MNYDEYKNLTEDEVKAIAEDMVEIKGHQVYFAEIEGHFGYCALVFCDGQHIHYADEEQLHYPESRYPDKASLRKRFIERLNEKLFTEDELAQPSDDYSERQAKEYFIRNYYPMRKEHVSMWYVGNPSEEQEAAKETMHPSFVAFAYFEDADFVRKLADLLGAFKAANDPLRDYEHAKAAFRYEMYNHEYAISWQGDWDVIRCFANVDGDNAHDMLPKTGWSEEVQRAYWDASMEVMEAYCKNPY